jgi:hypothetical protein
MALPLPSLLNNDLATLKSVCMAEIFCLKFLEAMTFLPFFSKGQKDPEHLVNPV